MTPARVTAAEAIARLSTFDALIDARTEAEYAEDRIPGAVNWPSLTNDERVEVGTLYRQVSPFVARKRGAVLVARNIARHVERELADTLPQWRPLVYCWRGGKRSGALATVLREIGFPVAVLEGGYREYRRAVIAALDELPAALDFRVVCGLTGSGKSRLLGLLSARGAQVLDLEALAEHRGSVLGLAPGAVQPSQKAFESRLWDVLRSLDPARPVWVESESRRIGVLRVPTALLDRMRGAACVVLELAVAARVALLLREYDFFVRDVDAFCARLDSLRVLRGHEQVNAWQKMAKGGELGAVVEQLLVRHYDPGYMESLRKNYAGLGANVPSLAWTGMRQRSTKQRQRCFAYDPRIVTDNVENLILEHLKALRADMSDVRREVREVKARLASLENQVVQMHKSIAFVHEDIAALNVRVDGLSERMEKIERRLELREAV